MSDVPVYEYRCRSCDSRFEVRRPMAQANAPAPCPNEHDDTVRLLSMFGSISTSTNGAPAAVGGGCCGGGCGCGR